METAPRDLGATARSTSPVRSGATMVLVIGLALVLVLGVLESGRRIVDLDRQRDEELVTSFDLADVGGGTAEAFRRVRPALAEGDRFALVFGPDVTTDQRNTYRLVSLAYFYPAIATSDPARADAVLVFGEPTPPVRESFDEIDVVAGVWLGERR
jgi:hypothetical protein